MRPARFFIALALVAGLLAMGAPVSADDGVRAGDPSLSGPAKTTADDSPLLRAAALQKPRRYSPAPGVVFNTALGPRENRNRIFGKIIAAINHAPKQVPHPRDVVEHHVPHRGRTLCCVPRPAG